MANLKRLLAGAMALCMAGAMFTSCGDTKDDNGGSGGSAGNGGSSDFDFEKANGNAKGKAALKEEKMENVAQNVEGSEDSQKTLRVYTWNDEFKERFRDYYPDYDKDASGYGKNDYKEENDVLKDGTKIVWVTTPTDNNAYQNKLDTDLKAQADSADKIDMFLIEADYALKYVNGPYVKPIKDLGITDDDMKDMYQYTKDIVTDSNGDLQAVSWQATPGLFAYRRDIAKEVLGTDDPAEVQEMLSDWDKFADVAAKMKEKDYCMLSGYDDAYRVFSNNVTNTWVNEDYEIVVDDNLMKWVDQTKDYSDKGYNNGTSLWDDQWKADQSSAGKVFGFFYSTWGINFTLLDNAGQDLFGQYAVCYGPEAYYWGGTWICAADGTDNPELVADIMKKLTCDKDIALQISKDTLDYTNNQAAMKEIAEDAEYGAEFLGGQNHFALFYDTAPNIDASKAGPYDQGLNESFQQAFKNYFTGNLSMAEALDAFYTSAIEKLPLLKKPE